MTKEPARGTEE